MTAYVDSIVRYPAEPEGYVGRPRRLARWSHLTADSERELHRLAARIGLRRDWYQGDHYDLVPARRDRAIELGAVELSRRDFVLAVRRLRASGARRR